jgi:uncharacterized membrane-anchored protein YhcB (DUF1043 family)
VITVAESIEVQEAMSFAVEMASMIGMVVGLFIGVCVPPFARFLEEQIEWWQSRRG